MKADESLVAAFRKFTDVDPSDKDSIACLHFMDAIGMPDTNVEGCLVAASFFAGWMAAKRHEASE